jgi:glycosyltransferase involved in cell wall biosynthesis
MMIAVVIPAYNAQRNVAEIVVEARKQLEPVIVVDDGSKDGTGAVAEAVGAIVLRHEKNRGKGAALKTAFAWALDQGYDAVITVDADGQHLPGEIPKFVERYQRGKEDLIIGGRAHLFHEMLPRRRNANRLSAWCIAKCSGVEITDSQSGFRLYSARLLRAIKLHTDGFDMESEVIVLAGRRGFRIITIPIDLGFVDGISTSHFKPLKDTLRIVWTVTRARFLW